MATSKAKRVKRSPAYLEVEIAPGPDGFPVMMPKEPVETLSAATVRRILSGLRAARGRLRLQAGDRRNRDSSAG